MLAYIWSHSPVFVEKINYWLNNKDDNAYACIDLRKCMNEDIPIEYQ